MSLKILFVGDGSYSMYAKAFYEAASDISDVEAGLMDYGRMNITVIPGNAFFRRAEYHFCLGIHVKQINQELIRKCEMNYYDIVFLYSAELIYASTVKQIKELGTYVAVYHNDNPFSPRKSKFRLRHFLESIKYSDLAYAYRKSNVEDYYKYGACRSKVLRSYYIRKRNYYIPDGNGSDGVIVPRIAFIGHFENDGRLDYIEALANTGIDVGVINGWPITCKNMIPISEAQSNYNEVLNSLDIAIVFLSSLNEDTYTRRCFEIPMAKTMMLSVYTEDMATLYQEDKEIVFFRGIDEFVQKAQYYLEHDDERETIAEAAFERCLNDGHEVKDRVQEIIKDYRDYMNK